MKKAAGTGAWIATAATLVAMTAACVSPAVVGEGGVPPPSDPQIVSIAIALNEAEVTTSRPATSQAADPEVRGFAERMVSEHDAVIEDLRRLDIPPARHGLGTTILENAEATATNIGQYTGEAFDRTYIDSQISLHQYALGTLDEFLIPSARDAQLRQMLEQKRMMVQEHLEDARRIGTSIGPP